jgi:hypothetical protein
VMPIRNGRPHARSQERRGKDSAGDKSTSCAV